MANKKMDLKTWLEKEKELKKEFIKLELFHENLIKMHIHQNNEAFIQEAKPNALTPSYNHMTRIENYLEFNYIDIYLYDHTFEQLKKNFRTFKFQKMNTLQNRIKKQIYLDQKALTQLDKIMTENNLATLQNSINFLLDDNNFQLKKKNEQIKQLSEQQKVLQEQFNQAQYQLSQKTQIISQLQLHRWQLENKLETYVEATLLPIISTRLQEILKNELASITDQQLDSIDLNTLISKKIKSEVIGQLYYFFISTKESN